MLVKLFSKLTQYAKKKVRHIHLKKSLKLEVTGIFSNYKLLELVEIMKHIRRGNKSSYYETQLTEDSRGFMKTQIVGSGWGMP